MATMFQAAKVYFIFIVFLLFTTVLKIRRPGWVVRQQMLLLEFSCF